MSGTKDLVLYSPGLGDRVLGTPGFSRSLHIYLDQNIYIISNSFLKMELLL